MERESNQLEAGPILCRMGCGFFGSPNTDGLCSKCYKDNLKKKQAMPSGPSPAQAHAAAAAAAAAVAGVAPPPTTTSSASQTCGIRPATPTSSTGQPTIPTFSQPVGLLPPGTPEKCSDAAAAEEAGAAAAGVAADVDAEAGSPEKDGAKKKKNKCHMCKKKVGLTGFTCRCGGLFCSVHRYSNEHHCTFDYREHGAEEIRKNNPVIRGEKIQKI